MRPPRRPCRGPGAPPTPPGHAVVFRVSRRFVSDACTARTYRGRPRDDGHDTAAQVHQHNVAVVARRRHRRDHRRHRQPRGHRWPHVPPPPQRELRTRAAESGRVRATSTHRFTPTRCRTIVVGAFMYLRSHTRTVRSSPELTTYVPVLVKTADRTALPGRRAHAHRTATRATHAPARITRTAGAMSPTTDASVPAVPDHHVDLRRRASDVPQPKRAVPAR